MTKNVEKSNHHCGGQSERLTIKSQDENSNKASTDVLDKTGG